MRHRPDQLSMTRRRELSARIRRVALLFWGDCFEDYLDHIGWSVDDFCERGSGGWAFGYVEALARVGIEVVMVCVVRSVKRTESRVHAPSGRTIVLLPATRALRLSRRWLQIPYRYLAGDDTAAVPRLQKVAYHVLPYLATPRRALAHMVVHERCDALMVQSYEDARFDIAVRIGRHLGVPVFTTAQGGELHRSRLEQYSGLALSRAAQASSSRPNGRRGASCGRTVSIARRSRAPIRAGEAVPSGEGCAHCRDARE